MSAANHDQSPLTAGKALKTATVSDDSAFDVRKIKRERSDVSGDNEAPSDSGCGAQERPVGSGNGPKPTNGFYTWDLLQGVLAHHGPQAQHEKVRLMIEDAISEDSKCRVQEIFLQVEQLKIEEKLLLYLKLPISLSSPGGGLVDPLRQPLNPLGNRYEIHQTIMWIRTHLEEDPDVSLPKQEVYDEYNMFCTRNAMKPLSTADFGKVMKQVYPRVRPRRLGTRGNSRYCYAGMRKRVKLDPPALPNVTNTQSDDEREDVTEEMLGAASALIREWAENLLGLKFLSLSALARHLVDNLCVDTRSLSAICILCAAGDSQALTNKDAASGSPAATVGGKPGKLREAQLQLQRKLQQREHIRDQKHRCLDVVTQNQNKEKTVDNSKGSGSKGGKKNNRTSQSPQGTNTSAGQSPLTKPNVPAVATGRHKRVPKPGAQPCNSDSLESNCDNIVVETIEDSQHSCDAKVTSSGTESSLKETRAKNPRKRTGSSVPSHSADSSPEKQPKLLEGTGNVGSNDSLSAPLPRLASLPRPGKISVVPSSSLKPVKFKAAQTTNEQPVKNCDNKSSLRPESHAKTNGCANTSELSNDHQDNPKVLERSEKLCTIDADALDDYLNGGNNSQEQEEELLQYFQQGSSSSSDAEINSVSADTEQISRSDKVSQLRLILQQNLKAGTAESSSLPEPGQIQPTEKPEVAAKSNLILPTLLNNSSQSSTRRRVSFETNVVEHFQDQNNHLNTVPQSPNTRRRIFNFTPISPGPHSPINGRASKPSSANASPFVSPRNTPVPRARSNVQANGPRSRGSQKTLSRSMSCSTPYTSRNETFVVPTSGPELTRQMSAPQSPLANSKLTEVLSMTTLPQVGSVVGPKLEQLQGPSQTSSFLPSDLAPQKQLLINYPSQENLQEIKNVYQKSQPADQEISELFHGGKQFSTEQLYYRSQSVPLHRMVNPTLMSPLSTQHYSASFQSQSFNASTSSSVAPTPVPSEFNDFGPIGPLDGSAYLLNDTDANFISDGDSFLIGDKEISPENITNILNILQEHSSQILPGNPAEETLLHSNGLILDGMPNATLSLPVANIIDPGVVLDSTVSGNLQRIIQSRSYPNTPLPLAVTYASSYPEENSSSKSYPSTPMHQVQPQEAYPETNEPMLSSPTLNSLGVNAGSSRNVADLLEPSFLGDADAESGDLDPLENFDGLQDVDSLTPLFNDVAEQNR